MCSTNGEPSSKRIAFSYDNFLFSEVLHDVVFQFEDSDGGGVIETIPAHSQILAFVSDVFHAQFFGPLPEKTIKIEDASIDTFRVFLRCLYTGDLQITVENMFELAYLANKYLIRKVTEEVAAFFKSKINEEDKFWKLFNPRMIALFDDEKQSAWTLLVSRFQCDPAKCLNADGFLLVNKDIVGQLVRTEPLAVREADLFAAVFRWAMYQCKRENVKPTETNLGKHVDDFIHELRLPTIGLNELVYKIEIQSSPFLTSEEKVNLVSYCAGLVSQPIPFVKIPRQKSLDVLVCPATRKGELLSQSVILSHFVPSANYRFFGVSCLLNIRPVGDTLENEQIKFELRSSREFDVECKDYDSLCSFEWKWKADSGFENVIENYEVTCLARDIIPLVPGRYYALVLRPSTGISLWSFVGDFVENWNTYNSSICVKKHGNCLLGVKSLHLLRP